MKRPEILFAGLLLFTVPPAFYLMVNTTRFETHEITCTAKNDIFKVNYKTLSMGEMLTLERDGIQNSITPTEVSSNSFSFSDQTKIYKIYLDSVSALTIQDGVNEIFNCELASFKM